MQTKPSPSGRGVFRRALLAVALLTASISFAQSSGTGVLTGRVYSSVTNEFVRNAEIQIVNSSQSTVSGNGGNFRIANLPEGVVEVVVSYAGYADIRSTATIRAGQTTSLELDFSSRGSSTVGDDGTVVMAEFVVSSEIEGNAKALMEQRNSMDLGRSIASDVFGDVTEGNVGEFLKYLPGIEMEYVEADTRGPRLGGLNPEYTGVSVDGMKQASADAFMQYGGTENGSTGGGGRSFSFEQVSINSIESIEITRVTPANLDADAPAGTINLKTKRAFDRKGRLIKWAASMGMNSEEFHLGKSAGPGDGPHTSKVKPTLSFSYADSFFDNRLGVLFGYSSSNLYNEQYRVEHTYQRTPTTTDPRPQVLTQVRFKDGPKWTNRTTFTSTVDFKATEDLMFSLSAVRNLYEASFYNRNLDFRATANNTSATNGRQWAGGDGLTTFSTNSTSSGSASNRYVATGGGNGNKQTKGYTVTPKFEWRLGDLLIEGSIATSYSDNTYDNLRKGRAGDAQTNNLTGVQFTATRSNEFSGDWNFVQTGGLDWTDVVNYTNPRITDDVRHVEDEINAAKLDFTYTMNTKFPVVWRAGMKIREQTTNSDRTSDIARWNYIGPGGGTTGSWAAYPSLFTFDPAALGPTFKSLNGGGVPAYTDREAAGRLFLSNPEYFVQSYTPAQYYTANFANVRRFQEDVTAYYAMFNTQLHKLTIQAGVRFEGTTTNSEEFDPLLPSEVKAKGYAVSASTGQATTVEGLEYQYRTKPKVNRKGSYDRYHPSISFKYRVNDNFIVDAGAGHTVRRPEVPKLVGLYSYNEDSEIITAANANLLPEFADRLAASASYYFGGTNNLTLTLSDTNIDNLFIDDEYSATEFGIEDPDYENWTVRSTRNSPNAVRFRSLELSYRQSLTFLPGLLQGTSFFVNYTRAYARQRQPGVTPHVISSGLDWRYKRLGMGLKGVWADDAAWTTTEGRYRPAVLKLDASIDYRIRDDLTIFVQGRNITNEDHVIYEAINGNRPVVWRRENYGANYVFGVRGQF